MTLYHCVEVDAKIIKMLLMFKRTVFMERISVEFDISMYFEI
jgi:hypothetical protein